MTLRNITKQVIAFLLVLFVCIGVVMGGQGNLSASAASEIQAAFEERNVLDDLTGGTVGGKKFSLADYPHNSEGKPQIVSFTEFCYSYYAEKQGDYGLYVYVYNPQDIAFDTQTSRNQIQLTYGSKASYAKYSLIFCNYSTQAGYEGRFYKFKVQLTESEKEDILQTIKPDARVYKVSGIELSYKGQVTDYPCAQSYTYTGFAQGYGSELATSDTLSCRVNGFEKYLTLDVHSTYYRPEGTNGKNDYTQDSLHSVYFAIPRSVVSEYGKMTAVHATWLDATLAPVLVTGNKEAYDAILPYLGQNIGTNTEGLEHAYAGSANYTVTSWAGATALYGWDCAYTFNLPSSWNKLGGSVVNKSAREVSPLYWLDYAGEGADSADGYVLSSEEIETKLKEYTQKYGGELVNDRYSRVLFDTVAESFTEVNIQADEAYSLTNEVLGSSWWDKLWGITYPSTFDGIKAIYEVTDADFKDDEKATCDGLFLAEQDYAEFKAFYGANKEENVVYLFRYQVTDFISSEATHFVPESGLGEKIGAWNTEDTNAYFMQETVNLDFDIIDVTCTKDNVETVLPVVSSPIDNIPDGTPPVHTTSDKRLSWWQILLAVLALILVVWLLLKFAPVIVLAAGKVIALPFKAIGAAGKKVKEKRIKDRGERARKKMDREFEKFHKESAKKRAKAERDYKKIDVEKLKQDIWSGRRDELDMNDAELYALSHDEEWLKEQEILGQILYGGEDDWGDL